MIDGSFIRWLLILRAYAFPVVAVPLLTGSALAGTSGHQVAWHWLPLLLGALLCLHSGINLINDYYDDRRGVDRPESTPTSWALTQGWLRPAQARSLSHGLILLSFLLALPILLTRHGALTGLALAGVTGSYFYSAPPLGFKYRSLGEIVVFLCAGPLLTAGIDLALTGTISVSGWLSGVPLGFLAAAILYGNNLRDQDRDAAAGFHTLAHWLGTKAHLGYPALITAAWLSLGPLVVTDALALPWAGPPILISLALLIHPLRTISHNDQIPPDIDIRTARAHAAFGTLLALGVYFS